MSEIKSNKKSEKIRRKFAVSLIETAINDGEMEAGEIANVISLIFQAILIEYYFN